MNISNEANACLNELYKINGYLTASMVYDAGKDPESPLHNYFEWDSDKALKEYNLIKARRLIRVAVIEGEPMVHVPQIITVDEQKKEGVYNKPSVIVKCISEYERALGEALTRLRAAEKTVDVLKSVATDKDIIAVISIAMQAISAAREAIQTLH